MQIFIIDDDQSFVKEIRDLLREAGYDTIEAQSMEQAKKCLSQHGPRINVALVDMFMGTDREAGLKLIQQMRHEHPRIVPIVLTGHGQQENAGKCIEAGAFQYILKDTCPASFLLQIVKQACNQFAMLDGVPRLLRSVQDVVQKCKELQKCADDLKEDLQRVKDEANELKRGLPEEVEQTRTQASPGK